MIKTLVIVFADSPQIWHSKAQQEQAQQGRQRAAPRQSGQHKKTYHQTPDQREVHA